MPDLVIPDYAWRRVAVGEYAAIIAAEGYGPLAVCLPWSTYLGLAALARIVLAHEPDVLDPLPPNPRRLILDGVELADAVARGATIEPAEPVMAEPATTAAPNASTTRPIRPPRRRARR